MRTVTRIELSKDGTRTVFHRREGGTVWTHPVDQPYMRDFEGEVRACPACRRPDVNLPGGREATDAGDSRSLRSPENARNPSWPSRSS